MPVVLTPSVLIFYLFEKLLALFYSGSAPPNLGGEVTQGQPSRLKNTAQKTEQRKLPDGLKH
jgi:hypothetical protein